jgi:hypothetical protein
MKVLPITWRIIAPIIPASTIRTHLRINEPELIFADWKHLYSTFGAVLIFGYHVCLLSFTQTIER